MAVSDAVCLLASSYFLFGRVTPYTFGSTARSLIDVGVWVATFYSFGLYAPRYLSAHEEFRRVVGAVSAGIVLVLVAHLGSVHSISRASMGASWATVMALEFATRRMWRGYLSRLKRKGKLVQRTLIVGTNQAAAEVASTLTHTRLGYHPIGYVALSLEQPSPDGLPCLGSIDQLDDVISRCPADCLFVASAGVSAHDMVHIASVARRFEVEIRLSASLPNTLTTRIHVHPVGDLMTISLKPVRLTRSQGAVKRISDIVLASIALIATLPLQLLIALIIKCTSGGPVLFRQRRVTKAGRVFEMYKFRTMISHGGRSSDVNSTDVTEPFYKLRNDPRLTRVGRLLRVYSLDEFPQLFNVIRGDMSLVGPRPLPAEQVAKNLKLLRPRHEVCAGMTGWWQIHGRSLVSAEEALRLDLFYIENWSLSLDLYILLRTFGSLIGRRGAF